MNLIIVESPTKAKTLSRFLGKEFVLEATMGHIKDLPKSVLGVDVKNNFKPDYQIVAKRENEIKNIKDKAKKASQIYLASDPDREGEAIAAHVKELIGNGKTKRIVFHEITKSAVEEAIKNSRKIDTNLVDAQIARRVLDRLVGYKLSPLLWRKVRRGLSAGRVQTVAVRLIVEREKEMEAFKKEEFWEIFCEVKKGSDKKFVIQLIKVEGKKVDIKNRGSADKAVSNLKKSKYAVFDVQKKEVHKNPYPPYTTSTMTQAGARIFAWPAKRTMSIAQHLYEKGLITYHRTDSLNLSQEAVAKAREYIGKEFGVKYLPESARIYKTRAKVAQEAHEAIRPTRIDYSKSKFLKANPTALKLYELIWKRFVACQMSVSVFDETTIDIEAANSVHYLLRASGQIMKFDGWKKLYKGKVEGEVELPEVNKGDPLQLIKVISEQKFTQPPARYNEASLIKTLEQLGIGRPSTYAPIISTIQIRKYVEKDEGKFIPTNVGVAVNDFLVSNFPDVFEYQFTADMEGDLDKIANGEEEWVKVMKRFYSPFENKLEVVSKKAKRVKIEVEKLGKKCPLCKKGELVVRIGRFGKFVSCSRFPDCKFTDKYEERIGMNCPKCKKGHVIIKKTGKGRKFFGCSRYPDCDWASWTDPKAKKEK